MESERFSRKSRLSGKATFQHLFKEGTSLRQQWLGLTYMSNGEGRTRFGCSVRRGAAKGSVERNRVKRWLREAFRRNEKRLPKGVDIVAIVFQCPKTLSYKMTEEKLLQLGSQLKPRRNLSAGS